METFVNGVSAWLKIILTALGVFLLLAFMTGFAIAG